MAILVMIPDPSFPSLPWAHITEHVNSFSDPGDHPPLVEDPSCIVSEQSEEDLDLVLSDARPPVQRVLRFLAPALSSALGRPLSGWMDLVLHEERVPFFISRMRVLSTCRVLEPWDKEIHLDQSRSYS